MSGDVSTVCLLVRLCTFCASDFDCYLTAPSPSVSQPGKQKKKFSSFFKSLVIELDKDLYGPDNHLVEVSSNTAAGMCTQGEADSRAAQPTFYVPLRNFLVMSRQMFLTLMNAN